ncbi:hypothetical protein FB451DRAFT_1364770 [Mycena latifolia]|nr:hypothetical protein FB451DRAFT_1364770 [Mycena latifolia]
MSPTFVFPKVHFGATLTAWGTTILEDEIESTVNLGDVVSFKVLQLQSLEQSDGSQKFVNKGRLCIVKGNPNGDALGRTCAGDAIPKGAYEVLESHSPNTIRLKSLYIVIITTWCGTASTGFGLTVGGHTTNQTQARFANKKLGASFPRPPDGVYWMNFASNDDNLQLYFDGDRKINAKNSRWAFYVSLVKDTTKEYEAEKTKEKEAKYQKDLENAFGRVIFDLQDSHATVDEILNVLKVDASATAESLRCFFLCSLPSY